MQSYSCSHVSHASHPGRVKVIFSSESAHAQWLPFRVWACSSAGNRCPMTGTPLPESGAHHPVGGAPCPVGGPPRSPAGGSRHSKPRPACVAGVPARRRRPAARRPGRRATRARAQRAQRAGSCARARV
ncbi:hypothetical protein F751_1315 [Auxenochlorella protothecoides]|uniref:Uncharacterized protein n=1 Tax=Auxenochlorella protothecoides TaxID=3075 RepID=A0A087SN38_AUXPR|nr:hypothetical protein F751_1315 [Auxenochlorella protothecoides]KFM27142.1 hypothetical protein F751_1315 [Auxenochlorella protothecoides]